MGAIVSGAHKHALLVASGLVMLSMAGPTRAQSVPRTGDISALLPSIPLAQPLSVGELALQAIPGLGRGVQLAPGVIADRIVRPRCIFIANQNQGNGSVRQTADIGRVQIYCP